MNKFNICLGQFASGKNYFPREKITNSIWSKLAEGNNILLTAPRRVGKTSIMNNLKSAPQEGYIVIYETTESVNNENEFYKRLFKKIILELTGFQKTMAKLKEIITWFPSIKKIGTEGIEFGESKISYFEEFKNLISKLNLGNDKLILMIDEFPSTVENIIKDEAIESANHFLQTNRELRQTTEIKENIQFIYAGSIGLENLVARVNGLKFINDIVSVKIMPLKKEEAKELINNITAGSEIIINDEIFEYLLKKIEWYIPFYFHLIFDEIEKILWEISNPIITFKIIDEAINNALQLRNYFEPWLSRLRTAFKGSDFSFVRDLLSYISVHETMEINVITNLSFKYGITETYKNNLNSLIYDGYINNNDNHRIYRYNSPLLREWWRINVAE